MNNNEKERMNRFGKLVKVCSVFLKLHDKNTYAHSVSVQKYTGVLCATYNELFPEEKFTDFQIELIKESALIHDIGKIRISKRILNKSGKLNTEEMLKIYKHSETGSRIIKEMAHIFRINRADYEIAYNVCINHHERIDGCGYPEKKKDNEIPVYSEIVAMADVYDALLRKRSYKETFSSEKALSMICNSECGKFSPEIIDCLKVAKFDLKN